MHEVIFKFIVQKEENTTIHPHSQTTTEQGCYFALMLTISRN